MKKIIFIAILLLAFVFEINAQDKEGTPPNFYATNTSMWVAPSLSSKTFLIPAENVEKEMMDGRSKRITVVPGKGSTGDDVLAKKQQLKGQQKQAKVPSNVFTAAQVNGNPTDPTGAIGLNHYFATFNTGFRIFDKTGTALTGQLSPANLGFTAGFCCDMTVSYDNAADRWVVSILYSNDGHVEVAVSTGSNPVTTTWNVYSFAGINDYQKVSVWSDGYYMTAQVNSGSAGTSSAVFVLDRSTMLAGATTTIIAFPLPGITTNGFYSPQGFNVSNNNLPATGSAPIVYMQDDAWSGVATDHLKLWEINVDWGTPANSNISGAQIIPLTPFISVFDNASFVNLSQPNGGTDVDALQATIMNQAQFRRFGTHNSAVFNFVVDTDGTAGELAGVRWMELRQAGDGLPWSLYQEGTYVSPNGKHAWNASLIMDSEGSIGMGYTAMGGPGNTFVGSYYTGRNPGDPLGTMSVAEQVILAGDANIPGTRYGDYSKIDVDPSDDRTFWFNNEMMQSGRSNIVGVFQIPNEPPNDLCADAETIAYGSTTSGTTSNSTFDSVGFCGTTNTAPGVWYSFTGLDGLTTLSTCNQASYDTKISVFTGNCGSLVCVDGLDDTTGCSGFSTELDICTTAGVTYYVLVHGFSGATGDFDLTLSNTPSIPVISCPSNATVECGNSTSPGNTGVASATDTCDPSPGITFVDVSVPGCGNTEVITRTWTATNIYGNSASCTQTITVVDTTPPAIVCPANVTVECGNSTAPSNTGAATATDACGTASISFSDISVPGCGLTEVITRTWTATDACGNSSSCSQTITVVDTTPPSITCPPNVTVESDLGSCNATGVNLGTPAVFDICDPAVSVTNDAPASYPFGDTTVTWTATDDCGNSSTCTQTVTVDEINTITTVTATPNPQQYSDLVTFEATIQPGNCPGAGLAATSVSFYVRDQLMGTVGLVLDGGNLVGSLTEPLIEIPSPPATGDMAPGIAEVTAEFNGINSNYEVNDATVDLTIDPEDANVEYTGHTLQATPSANSSEATVVLSANIQDVDDGYPGDIRNALVQFVDRDSGDPISPWLPVTDLFDPSDSTIGTVSYEWLVDLGNQQSKSTTVGIIVGGYYTQDESSDDTIVTVYKPKGDFITGGGYIIPDNSAGSYASTAGLLTNFGYNVKYTKKGNKLKGHLNVIFRRMESDGVHTYQIKGNAIQSLGVDIADETALIGEFVTKANLKDITDPLNPVNLGGNHRLHVDMTDRGEPGIDDSISFNLSTSSGILLYSSDWTGIATAELTLSGGNIVVHSGFSTTSATSADIIDTSMVELGLFEIVMDENPFDITTTLTLKTDDTTKLVQYAVYDINNKLLLYQVQAPSEQFTFGKELVSGMYIVSVTQGSNIKIKRLIKR